MNFVSFLECYFAIYCTFFLCVLYSSLVAQAQSQSLQQQVADSEQRELQTKLELDQCKLVRGSNEMHLLRLCIVSFF